MHAQQTAIPPDPTSPQVFEANGGVRIRVVPIASGLVHPWSIAFAPDAATILIAEQPGRLRVIRNGVLDPQPVWTSPSATGTDNLHGVAVHPQFAQNRFVYLSYPKREQRGSTLAVARGRFDGTALSDVREIFVADAWETGGNVAGRIVFGPDNSLYVAVGDRDRICCNGSDDNSLRMKAQDLSNHVGKVLRLRDDGTVPADNPFAGRPGAKPEIFTYGHRNTYGFTFHPETRELWQASSIAFYTGNRFPAWKGNLFVGALNGLQLQRIAFNQPSQAERREPLLAPLRIRIRDVQQGPDGYLYVATEKRSGGSAPDGTVLRIEPAE
jgi:glucose/arabinose dehydrogenase